MTQREMLFVTKYKDDSSSRKRSISGIKKMENALTQQENIFKNIEKAALRTDDVIVASASKSEVAIDSVNQKLREQENQLRQNATALEARNTDFNRVSNEVGLSGDVESSLLTIGGAASAFGAGGVGAGFAASGELFAVVEALPRLKTAASGLPNVVTAAASSLGLSGLAGNIQSLVPALGAAGASTVALLGPLAAVGAAIAAVTVATNQQVKAAEAAAEAEQRSLDLQLTSAEAQRDANQLLEQALAGDSGALEELRSKVEEFSNEVSSSSNDIDVARENIAAIIEETYGVEVTDDNFERFRSLFSNSNLNNYSKRVEVYEQQIEESTNAMENGVFVGAQYREALASLSEEQIKAIESANEQEEALESLTQERANAAAEIKKSNERIEALREQQAKAAERDAINEQFTEEQARIRERHAAEDHQKRLADIEQNGMQEVEALRGRMAALPELLAGDIADAESEARNEIAEANNEYMETQLESSREFQRQQAEAASDFALTVSRTMEDINNELEDAARNNDVVAFLRAERSGDKQLSRMATDRERSEQRQIANFRREQAQRRNAHEERINAIEASLEADKQALEDKYNKERAEIAKTIVESQKATAAELQQIRETRQRRLARERELEMVTIRRQMALENIKQAAHNEEMANIQAEREAAFSMYDGILARIRNISREAGISTRGEATGGLTGTRDASGNAITAGIGIGGDLPDPTDTGSSPIINVSLNQSNNTTVGDIASRSDIEQSQVEMAELTTQFVVETIQGLVRP